MTALPGSVPATPTAHRSPADDPAAAAADGPLRAALRDTLAASPPAASASASRPDGGALTSFEHRLMAQWAQAVPAGPLAVPARRAVPWWGLIERLRDGPRPRGAVWFGGVGVAAALLAGVLVWQDQRADAALEELSQIDVLSQMAGGEM